jgi:hypothetical protein
VKLEGRCREKHWEKRTGWCRIVSGLRQRRSVMQGVPDPIVDEYEHDGIYVLLRVRYRVADGVPMREVQY